MVLRVQTTLLTGNKSSLVRDPLEISGSHRKIRFLTGRDRISKREAFLLFEVMAAVAVLAFVLTYILSSFSTALGGLRSSQQYYKALSLLEEKMCEIEKVAIKEEGIAEGEEGDEFEGNENFRWKWKSSKVEDLSLNELRLKVYWLEGRREGSTSVITYLRSKD